MIQLNPGICLWREAMTKRNLGAGSTLARLSLAGRWDLLSSSSRWRPLGGHVLKFNSQQPFPVQTRSSIMVANANVFELEREHRSLKALLPL